MELDDAVPGDEWWPDFEFPGFESDADATEGEFPCSDEAGNEGDNEMHYLMRLEDRLAGVHDCGLCQLLQISLHLTEWPLVFDMQGSLDTSLYTFL